MTEISRDKHQMPGGGSSRVKHAVDIAEDYLRQSKGARRELRTAIMHASDALGVLESAPDQMLRNRAIVVKAGALLALGEFRQAIEWLSSIDRPSDTSRDLLVKALVLGGDSHRSRVLLSRSIKSLSAPDRPAVGGFQLFKYQTALLLARAIDMGAKESKVIKSEVLKMRGELLRLGEGLEASIYARYAFILGVVEAKCALVLGKIGEAAQVLSYPTELLKKHVELNQSSAIMEYLAISGEIQLLRRQPEAAAAHFNDLSVRFAFAEDSPVYFRRAVWGLIDAYTGNGRFDRLSQVEMVLMRRSGRSGALLAKWCSAMKLYAQARVGRTIDVRGWRRAIRDVFKAGVMEYSEGLTHHLRRAYVMMTRPRASTKEKVLGARVMTVVLESIATGPIQLGVLDTWRLSKMLDRWFAEVVSYDIRPRNVAAEIIVKILGDREVFAVKAGTYRLVVKQEGQGGSPVRDLIIVVD